MLNPMAMPVRTVTFGREYQVCSVSVRVCVRVCACACVCVCGVSVSVCAGL
jgi:hypothetical protein